METNVRDRPAFHGGDPVFPERFRFVQATLPPLENVVAEYQKAYAGGLITNAHLVARFEKAAAEPQKVEAPEPSQPAQRRRRGAVVDDSPEAAPVPTLPAGRMTPWQQYAQVLLSAGEFYYVN